MPSNRRPKPAEEKRAELIASARKLFVEEGYESTSMSRMAKEAGVTPNTIYWYFEDKDALLLSVLDGFLQEHLIQYQDVSNSPLPDQLYWVTKSLKGVSRLVTTLHSRIQFSEKLDQWHTRFHQLFDAIIDTQLPSPLPNEIRDAELRIVAFTIEGLISHNTDDVNIRKTCNALAIRLSSVSSHD